MWVNVSKTPKATFVYYTNISFITNNLNRKNFSLQRKKIMVEEVLKEFFSGEKIEQDRT